MRFLTILFLVLSASTAWAQDEGSRLERLLESQLSSDGRVVEIEGFEGVLTGAASLDVLTISDADGVWLRIEDAVLDWNRAALLRGRLAVSELSAARIDVPRLPAPGADAPDVEASGAGLPELPVAIRIDRIAVERAELGAPVMGVAAVLDFQGSLTLENGEGAADITANRLDGPRGAFVLQAGYANATRDLDLTLTLDEDAGGLAAELINLPGRPAIDLSLTGGGPLEDLVLDFALATDGVERLTGQARTRTTGADAPVAFAVELGGDAAALFAPDYRDFLGDDLLFKASGTRSRNGAVILEELALDAQSLRLEGSGALGADGMPERFDLAGDLSSGDGSAVLLPTTGAAIEVGDASLTLGFDAAQGPDWAGTLEALGVRVDAFDIGSLALTGDGLIQATALTAQIELRADGIVSPTPELSEAIGESVVVTTTLTNRADEPLRFTDFVVGAQTLSATGAAALAFEDRDLDVDARFALDASDLRAFSALADRPLAGQANLDVTARGRMVGGTLDVTARGETRDIQVGLGQIDPYLAGATALELDISRGVDGITINRLDIVNPQVEIFGRGEAASDEGRFNAVARLDTVAPVLPDLDGPASLALSASGRAANWTFEMDVEGAGVIAGLAGDAVLSEMPSGEVTLELEARDLSPFAELVGRPLAGYLDASGRLAGTLDMQSPLQSIADVDVSGVLQDVVLGVAQADPYLAGRTEFDLKVAQTTERIAIETFQLRSSAAEITGRGTLEGETGSVTVNARLADIAPLVPQMTGAAAVSLDADGLDGLWDVSASAALGAADLSVQGQVRPFDDAPSGDLAIQTQASDLTRFATLAGRPLAGAVEAKGSVQGTLNRDAPFQSVGTVALRGVARDLTLDVTEVDPYLTGETTFDIAAQRQDGLVVVDRLEIASDSAEISGSGSYEGQSGNGRVDMTLADVSPILPDARGPAQLSLQASGTEKDWDFAASAGAAQAQVDATGSVTLGEVFGGAVDLTLEAADLSRFAPLVGRPLAGSITATGSVSGLSSLEAIDVDLALDGQDIKIGQRDVDTLLQGPVTARIAAQKQGDSIEVDVLDVTSRAIAVTADGAIGAPTETLTLDVRVRDIAPFTGSIAGAATATGTIGPLQGSQLNVDVKATGPAGLTAEIIGQANVTTYDLDVAFNGAGPAALANRFIAPRTVDGPISFRGSVIGPAALTSLVARAQAQALTIVVPAFGLVLDPVEATVDLAGDALTLDVNATARDGGRISVSGPVTLAPLEADLAIGLDALRISDPNLYDTAIDGRVTISGPLSGGALIAGRVAPNQTELRIPSTGFATSALSGLVHVNEPFVVRQTRARAGLIEVERPGPAVAYGLDLIIDAPNRIFLRGRGLDAELGGQLVVGGTTLAPTAVGGFDLIRGRLDILGRRLTLTEGKASLEGSFDPALRLVATTQTEDVEVRIVIEGQASSPDIRFESDPELPEDEVLAQLLFGRGIDTLSPLQAAQLASAVATLAGRGGDGIIGRLRNTLGFDDLDVATSETGATDLRIGRYLGENLYTDVTLGSDGRSEVSLNLDLTPSVSVQGAVANDGGSSIGIFYQRDY